jgi:arginine/lysine/ornithine decarboxylase
MPAIAPSDALLTFSLSLAERAAAAARKAMMEPAGDLREAAAAKEVLRVIADLMLKIDRSGSLQTLGGLTGGEKLVGDLNRLIADGYGAPAARVVVAGSSGANLMVHGYVVPALLTPERRTMLVDRDAHVSLIGGLANSGLRVDWLHRAYDPAHDVQRPFKLEDIVARLDQRPDIGAVVLTSPTYEGNDAPLEVISQACRQRGVLLVVDGAWGACYGLLSRVGFPRSAIQRGADIAVVSMHKKGISVQQVASALFRDPAHAELFDSVGNLGFQTTSPNYSLLGVAEICLSDIVNRYADDDWRNAIAATKALAWRIPREVNANFRIIQPADVGAASGDPAHLLVHVGDAGITGYAMLAALDDLGFDAEKATRDTLLMLVGPHEAGRVNEWIETLRLAALRAARASSGPVNRNLAIPSQDRETVMTVREAALSPQRRVALADAAGEVAAAPVAPYPPGSPLLVPGERFEQRHVDYLLAILAEKGRVRGVSDSRTVAVVARPIPQS